MIKKILLLITFSFSIYPIFLVENPQGFSNKTLEKIYLEAFLPYEFPSCLANKELQKDPSLDLSQKAKEVVQSIHPKIEIMWTPTTFWQLFTLFHYFDNPNFRIQVQELGYLCEYRKTPSYQKQDLENHPNLPPSTLDPSVVKLISDPNASLDQLFNLFQTFNHQLAPLFVQLNRSFVKWMKEMERQSDYKALALHLITSLPEWEKWESEYQFPFIYSPWSDGVKDVFFLQTALKRHPNVIIDIINAEKEAFNKQQFLFFRGASLLPLKQNQKRGSLLVYSSPFFGKWEEHKLTIQTPLEYYALSYGSSLLGGVFLSTDACAIRYMQSEDKTHLFHGIAIEIADLLPLKDSCFSVPPLHPLTQLLSDGEHFHTHTKLNPQPSKGYLHGYFSDGNRYTQDLMSWLTWKQSDELYLQKISKIQIDRVIPFRLEENVSAQLEIQRNQILYFKFLSIQ